MNISRIVKELIFSTISACGGILAGVWVDENTRREDWLGPAFIVGSAATRTVIGIVDETLTHDDEEEDVK